MNLSIKAVSYTHLDVYKRQGNNGDTALNNCTFFSGANRKASANYFSGNDGIYQSVPDNWAEMCIRDR